MNLNHDLGNEQIKDVIAAHPAIGEILQRHEIGCVTCGVGICLLKDVVSIHALGEAVRPRMLADYQAAEAKTPGLEGEVPGVGEALRETPGGVTRRSEKNPGEGPG